MTPQFACHTRQTVVTSVCLLPCLLIPLALAADLVDLHIDETEGVYSIDVTMQMQVPAQYVHRVLTDYAHIYRLDPAITDSEILSSADDGVVRVRTRIDDCIAFFCKKIEMVEDVRDLDHGDLKATIVSNLSSFKSGHTDWKILGIGERTQVIYQAQMEPDFLIPPLIGVYFVKQKMQQRLLASMERIECIARHQAGLEHSLETGPVLVADGLTDDHTLGASLLADKDPTMIARAPAAGRTVRDNIDCARPCSLSAISCQP
jgi:hypothetical protein